MNPHQEILGVLMSWVDQTTPREYVRFLRRSQPEVFAGWSEDEMVANLESVVTEARELTAPQHA